MGYVHDTNMHQFISPAEFEMSAGTWAVSEANDIVQRDRAQADAAFEALIPIPIPSNEIALKGAMLKSIDVWYAIQTAAADDFATVELIKTTLPADDVAVSGEAPAITMDDGHDTAAKRKAADTDHKMTATLDTPAFIDEGEAYWLRLVVDAAATTDFTFYGAQANYTLRV